MLCRRRRSAVDSFVRSSASPFNPIVLAGLMFTFGGGQARLKASSSGSKTGSSSSGGRPRQPEVREPRAQTHPPPAPPSPHRTHSPVKSAADSKCPPGPPAQGLPPPCQPARLCLTKRQMQHQPVPGGGGVGRSLRPATLLQQRGLDRRVRLCPQALSRLCRLRSRGSRPQGLRRRHRRDVSP